MHSTRTHSGGGISSSPVDVAPGVPLGVDIGIAVAKVVGRIAAGLLTLHINQAKRENGRAQKFG